VHVALTVGYDPARLPEDVTTAIKLALGVTGEEGNGLDAKDGLFGLAHRAFGENAHVSKISGLAQQADGVRWVLVDAAQRIEPGIPPVTDPTELPIPGTRQVKQKIECELNCVLALYTAHLELNLVADVREEVCT